LPLTALPQRRRQPLSARASMSCWSKQSCLPWVALHAGPAATRA